MIKAACSIFFAMVLFCSCSQPKDLVYQNLENFSLNQVSGQSVVSMDVRLYNPNNYTLKLKKANLDVFVNGKSVGKLNVAGIYTISRLDTVSIPINLAVALKDILPNAIQMMMSSEIDIKLLGTIKIGRHGIYIRYPVNYEGRQDIRAGLRL